MSLFRVYTPGQWLANPSLMTPLLFCTLGGLFSLGMAPYNVMPVAMLAFIFFLNQLLNCHLPKEAFKYTFLFALVHFSLASNWMVQPFLEAMEASLWKYPAGLLGLLVVTVFMAFITALAMFVAISINRHFISSNVGRVLCISLCWVLGEMFRYWPLDYLAYIFIDTLYLVQLASVVGLFPFTFLLVSAFGFMALFDRGMFMGVYILLAMVSYGFVRLELLEQQPPSEQIKVRLVNASLSKKNMQKIGGKQALADHYIQLSITDSEAMKVRRNAQPDLIIWPESATTLMLENGEKQKVSREYITSFMTKEQRLITGGIRRVIDRKEKRFRYHNSVFLLRGDGQLLGSFDKQRLVPWGEFVPLREYLPKGMGNTFVSYNLKAGEGARKLTYRANLNILPLICLENYFPYLLSEQQTNQKFIVLTGSESLFAGTTEPSQYLVSARFRAIESGLPLVTASNMGYLAIIDKYGQLVKASFSGSAQVLDGVVDIE